MKTVNRKRKNVNRKGISRVNRELALRLFYANKTNVGGKINVAGKTNPQLLAELRKVQGRLPIIEGKKFIKKKSDLTNLVKVSGGVVTERKGFKRKSSTKGAVKKLGKPRSRMKRAPASKRHRSSRSVRKKK